MMPAVGSALTPILLVDDDIALAALLREYAESEGFCIDAVHSGEDAWQAVESKRFALVILDVMLPGIDGFEVLTRLRAVAGIPVLMLTTRGSTSDRVRGLREGADDYLPKPFDPAELIERMRSILRRVTPRRSGLSCVRVGDIELDAKGRHVYRNGLTIEVTGSEFALLQLLLSNAGDVLERDILVQKIFGREPGAMDRAIDNLVSNLRRKLGPSPSGEDRIQSVRGVGYVFPLSSSPSL